MLHREEGGVTHNFCSFVNQWWALHRGSLNVNTEILLLFTRGHVVTRIDILMHQLAKGGREGGCQKAAVVSKEDMLWSKKQLEALFRHQKRGFEIIISNFQFSVLHVTPLCCYTMIVRDRKC